ncbi:MAG: hypothetical protein HY560_00805 [Gemmatimonadetes bacterium]|nr:hypothetical protein [Gemmatimonadota bacterium]
MTRRYLWFTLAAALAPPGTASAQSPTDLLAVAVRTYQDLDYEAAATQFRHLLAQSPSPLVDHDQAKALSYLAAAEWLQGHRGAAVATFRQMVALDPRLEPDPLVFPPEVQSLFAEARREMKVVTAELPGDTTMRIGNDPFRIRLYASSSQDITVTLAADNANEGRTLYNGPINDSLELRWDGRDASGSPASDGRYFLRAATRGPAGKTIRTLEVPLRIAQVREPQLPMPPKPEGWRPERTPAGPAVGSLASALAAAAAAVALPTIVGARTDAGGRRWVVVGAISAAGALGFWAHRPGRRIDANITANQALRGVWQRQADSVSAENARRQAHMVLAIRADQPVVREPAIP